MPQSFADYDSQYHHTRQKHIHYLPTSQYQHQLFPLHHRTSPAQESFHDRHNHDQCHQRDDAHSASTSTATSRSTSANSIQPTHQPGVISIREASLKAQEIRPTSDVAEWAHQVHIRQAKSYWWCQGCNRKEVSEPLHIPKAVEKIVTGRRVRINEPSHCYDI